MLPEGIKDCLADFAKFARTLRGQENREAQVFLDSFFRAFGHAGATEARASFAFRVTKKPGSAELDLLRGDPGSSCPIPHSAA